MPNKYKFGLILTLLFRVYGIVSNPIRVLSEVEKLKTILKRNQYPEFYIERCIKHFLAKTSSPATDVSSVNNRTEVTMVIPYLGKISCKMRNNLKKLFLKTLPTIDLKIVFKTTYRVSNLFRFKDRLPLSLCSHFIYYFKCGFCNESYIGMSIRHHKVRLCEHMKKSPRTGKTLNGTTYVRSAIVEHTQLSQHIVSENDFKILSLGGSKVELEIKESLMIQKMKPTLNRNVTSTELFLFN